jgi:hypothetical protein
MRPESFDASTARRRSRAMADCARTAKSRMATNRPGDAMKLQINWLPLIAIVIVFGAALSCIGWWVVEWVKAVP